MDINMKDIKLIKDGNWICIDEGEKGKTKLLLDDGKYSNSTQLDLLRDRIAKYSEFNNVDSWDKLESGIDWLTTAGLAFWGSGGTFAETFTPQISVASRLVVNNLGSPMVNIKGGIKL